jgi:tRNA A-37 threonylcarbamoyl transferase component Bud32
MISLAGVTIHSKIYESSTSLVYRGRSEQDNRAIVVKLLKQDYPSPQELIRYRQEYEITRSLDLEGVLLAYSQQGHQRTLAIPLKDFGGESIEHWIRQRPEVFRPMPLSAFLPLAIDLSDILGKIHAANIIHKDINPGNIMQLQSRLLAVLGSNGQLIIDAIPEIELIIGKQPAVPEMEAIEAHNRFNRVFGQFIQVFCSKENIL